MAVTILLGEAITLLIKLYANLRNTTLIDMVSWVHRKFQTRVGESEDINKGFEYVTITDTKFSNRVQVWMTPKSTFINWVTMWLEQLNFRLCRWKWELPDQHIANWLLCPHLFYILILKTFYPLLYEIKFWQYLLCTFEWIFCAILV